MKQLSMLVLCLVIFSSFTVAQEQYGNIRGVVVDENGEPLPGVTVTLESDLYNPRNLVTSDGGIFRFLNVSVGPCRVKCELPGFKTYIQENIEMTVGFNVDLKVKMEIAALEEEVVVVAESPVVDLKKTGTSTTFTQEMLQEIPSARDPWVILQQTPGLLMGRENVGGSESGQQSGFVSKGESSDLWIMDGINITDMNAGASPSYYDFDVFEEISITTGMPDVENRDRAIVINMVTRRGQNRFGFGGRFYLTDESWQMNPSGEAYEAIKDVLDPDYEDPHIGYNHIKQIKDYGFNMGGPLVKDKVWWWLSYGIQEIETFVITGTADNTQLNNYAGKLNFQFIPDNRAEIFLYLADKKKQGRNATTSNPAGLNQHGKYHFGSPIFKIQDEHMFGDDLFISARYGFVDQGFGMWPAKDEDVKYVRWYDYENAIYNDPFGNLRYGSYFFSSRPAQFGLLQGIYYNDNLLGGSHEVKVGLELHNNQRTWVGGNTGNFAFLYHYYTPQIDVDLNGTRDIPTDWIRINVGNNDLFYEDGTDRYAGYLQDSITSGRLTFNLQVRFDYEVSYQNEFITRSLYMEDVEGDWHDNYFEATNKWFSPEAKNAVSTLMEDRISPEVSTPKDLRWWTISPRFGLTYDLFGNGKTILKAAFAMYPGGPLNAFVYYTPSGVYPWMNFWWGDQVAGFGNGDYVIQLNELYWAEFRGSRKIYRIFDDSGNFLVTPDMAAREQGLMWGGYDWSNPTALTPNDRTIDPNWKQKNDFDILVSVEREIFTDFGVGIDFTYRWHERESWRLPYYPQYDNDGVLTTFGERAQLDPSDPNYFPVEYLDHVRSQDDFMQAGNIPGQIIGDSPGESTFSTDQAAGRPWYVLKDEPWAGYTKYSYVTTTDRTNRYMGVDLRFNKRYSNNWMLSGSLTLQTDKTLYGEDGWRDPTDLWAYDGDISTSFISGDSGKGYANWAFSRWLFKLQGMYTLPFGFDISFTLSGHEGNRIDQYFTIVDYTLPNTQSQRNTMQMQTNSDQARLPDVWVMNAKVQKRLKLGDTGSVWISCDIFNTLNGQTLLTQRPANMGTYYVNYTPARYYPYSRESEPQTSLNPLVLRFGVRFQF